MEVLHRIQSTIQLLDDQIQANEQELRDMMFEPVFEPDDVYVQLHASLYETMDRREALEQRFRDMLLTPERCTR